MIDLRLPRTTVALNPLLPVVVIAFGIAAQNPQPSPPIPPVAVDVIAVPSGVVPSSGDVSVTVDGQRRTVISVRQILRGPGSEKIAADAASAKWPPPVAEPTRTIIVGVDETSISRGGEKKISAGIQRVLDLIGPADRAALVILPFRGDGRIALSTDRQPLWSALARLRGRAAGSADLALAHAEEPPPISDEETRESKSPTAEDRPTTLSDHQPGLSREAASARVERNEGGPAILRELRSLLVGVRELPGAKTVLLVRGAAPVERGAPEEAGGNSPLEALAILQVAASARATVHVIVLDDSSRKNDDEVTRLARQTGGDVFRLGKQADRELQRLGTWMSEGLRIAIEAGPGDRDGRPHEIAVATTRSTVRAPERWVPFDVDEEPSRAASVPSSPTATPSTGARSATLSTPAAAAISPELQRVLTRMSAYVAQYVQDFSAVVAEETYDQAVTPARGPRSRQLRSDFLLVRIPGMDGWMPFRDVFEVNGKPVRDRDDRLRKLFLEMPPDALDKARRILDEGARYNIGNVYRNINQPVLPLIFLMPEFIDGLQFRRAGDDEVEGVRAWRIDFQETAHPTLIKDDVSRRDMPASGSLWVDPVTGRIVKTRIRTGDITFTMDTTVVYRRSDTLKLWAPAEMQELYSTARERISGLAKYKNFRRFRVDVEEKIAVPKA